MLSIGLQLNINLTKMFNRHPKNNNVRHFFTLFENVLKFVNELIISETKKKCNNILLLKMM